MIIVDQPYFSPGVCILSGTGGPEFGPYIDLETEDVTGARRYIAVSQLVEMIKLIGGGSPQEMAAARETTERCEALQHELDVLRVEHELLKAGVATTLAVGAVFDRKTTRPKLRKVPAGYILAAAGGDDAQE